MSVIHNNLYAAALGAILIFAVVTVPALANNEENSGYVIKKILDAANVEASSKLQELQQDGIAIPDEINTLYSAASDEHEEAIHALDNGNITSARTHAMNALELFRDVFDLLANLDDEDEEEDDIEVVEEIDADISSLQEWADDLKGLASANNIPVSFSDFDLAVNATINAVASGNLAEAEENLTHAQELLEDIYDEIQSAAVNKSKERAREFAEETAERLAELLASAEEDGLPDWLVEELENAVRELQNSTDIDEILEITDDSSELQAAIDEYNSDRIENFDDEYAGLAEDIAALYASAEELDLKLSNEIDELLDSIRQQVDDGQDEDAAEELDRLDSLLHEFEDVVEEFWSTIEYIEETRNVALALKSHAESNGEPVEQIDEALSILDEADLAVQTAAEIEINSETINDVYAQLGVASELADEAEHVLDEIGEDLGYDQERFESIMETVSEYEDWADELRAEAVEANSTEALQVVDEALSLIEQARNAAIDGDPDQAESYLYDAQTHLENAEAILEAEAEQEENEESEQGEEGEYADEQEYQIRENSKIKLQVKEGDGEIELEIQMETGDIEPGLHDVEFTCQEPDVNVLFEDALEVGEYGGADFEATIQLDEGVHQGCNVSFETVSVDFSPFKVTGQHEEEQSSESGEEDEGDQSEEEPSEEEEQGEESGNDEGSGEEGGEGNGDQQEEEESTEEESEDDSSGDSGENGEEGSG